MSRPTKSRVAGLKHPPTGSAPTDVTELVPRGLRVAAAVAWRFLFLVAAIYVILWLINYFFHLVLPVAIALLLAALMAPAVDRLVDLRVPRSAAAALVLIAGIAIVGGVLTFVIIQFINGLPQLQDQVANSLDQIRNWLMTGPLHVDNDQITNAVNNAVSTIKENQAAITSGAITTAATIGEVLTGMLLTLFTLIFFLYDGRAIWRWVTRGAPRRVRDRVDVAGRRGFTALVSYVRATVLVALFDAVGIGIGLWIIGVPLVVPLAALVFLGAFIPILGAVLAGTVAVLVALVTNGFIPALLVLAIVVGVMQIEGHVLQPLLLGRAVKLHPLAVVVAITAGLIAAGIAGALISVPLLAVVNAGVKSLLHDEVTDPDLIDPLEESREQMGPDSGEDDGEDDESTADAQTEKPAAAEPEPAGERAERP